MKNSISVKVNVKAKGSNRYEFYLTSKLNHKIGLPITKTLSFVKSVDYLRYFIEHKEYIDGTRERELNVVLNELFIINN